MEVPSSPGLAWGLAGLCHLQVCLYLLCVPMLLCVE